MRLIFSFLLTLLYVSEILSVPVEPGVSRELALERRRAVTDVVYRLELKVDSIQEILPEGRVEMDFTYFPDGQPLQLDFAGESVGEMEVNGLSVSAPVWSAGHIVIDPELLSEGENTVTVRFTSADRALNRNPGYVYSLFVPFRAHSVFPCFDQPDIKASYNLSLTISAGWKAVGNSPVRETVSGRDTGYATVIFEPTEPLSTYLFAFAAGDFDYRVHESGNRSIGAYSRETDPDRLAQLDEIFAQVDASLDYLEDYTGMPYPFAKYDLVILPGFQFGGMEHTGATFYNDNVLFLGKSATAADRLRRAQVIAHETAHMWFGDYVTMEWFDDVWTKEVLANYFAAMMARELLPDFDHDLEWLRVYMAAALDQDRSEGSTAIRQPLTNMNDAGLIYNNIIYNKSPLMMEKLVEIAGKENFKAGIRKYLSEHPYGNATWVDLVGAIDFYGQSGLDSFSRVWVYEPGMPRMDFSVGDGMLVVRQTDPRGRGLVWPQEFDVMVVDHGVAQPVTVCFDGSAEVISEPVGIVADDPLIIPSADGRAYGLLVPPRSSLRSLLEDVPNWLGDGSLLPPVGSLATLMMLNENYLDGNIGSSEWLEFLLSIYQGMDDPQWLSAVTRYVGPALLDLPSETAATFERRFIDAALAHPSAAATTLMMQSLIPAVRSEASALSLYEIWEQGRDELFDLDLLTDMSYILAILLPARADDIITTQRSRVTDPDRLRKFDFISRAAVSDPVRLDSLFQSLDDPSERKIEPWTRTLLSLLNHPARHDRSIRYIRPALELLPELQLTGDIFFPSGWASTLLSSYRSPEALAEVEDFIHSHPRMNTLLLGKVREAAARLRLLQSR